MEDIVRIIFPNSDEKLTAENTLMRMDVIFHLENGVSEGADMILHGSYPIFPVLSSTAYELHGTLRETLRTTVCQIRILRGYAR